MFELFKKDSKETDKKLLLEAWKEVVNVQMHFNDMEMKIRSLAVTVITAISGAIGYLLKENIHHQFIIVLSFIGIAAWLCFYLMDRFMYHKLLIGAVNSGINLEEQLSKLGINVDLGEQIKEKSPLKNLFGKKIEMHSDQKLDFFYITVPVICINGILSFLVLGLLVIFIVPALSCWGLYSLAKGYKKGNNGDKNNKENNYNWVPYRIFLFSNILFMLILYAILTNTFINFENIIIIITKF